MLRPHEMRKEWYMVNGATWVLISATVAVLLFSKIVAITVFSILIISDMVAALIGRRYGKRKLFDKSVEGTAAFIISAALIVVGLYGIFDLNLIFLIAGVFGGTVAGLVEAASVSLKLDDNLSIPLSAGIVMELFRHLLGGFGWVDTYTAFSAIELLPYLPDIPYLPELWDLDIIFKALTL
jgi:dolichol kinase